MDTLFLGSVIVATMTFAAVVLHYATSGLWLLVHNVLEGAMPQRGFPPPWFIEYEAKEDWGR